MLVANYTFLHELFLNFKENVVDGLEITNEPKIAIGIAILFTLYVLNRKFRRHDTEPLKRCQTCGTKPFKYYQSKRFIVCVERFNYFFFSFFFMGSAEKILVPFYFENLISNEIKKYFNGLKNLPIFIAKGKISRTHFELYKHYINPLHFKRKERYVMFKIGQERELQEYDCIFDENRICSKCIHYYLNVCLYYNFMYNIYVFGFAEAKRKYNFFKKNI